MEHQLKQVRVTSGQAIETDAALQSMKRSLSGVTDVAMRAADRLGEVKLGMAATVETVANAKVEERALKGVEEQALRTALAMRLLGGTDVDVGVGRQGLLGRLLPGGSSGGIGRAIERALAAQAGDGGGFGGAGSGGAAHGLVGGVLPGGARASAGAVTTGLGLLLAAGPSAGPALAGVGVGSAAGAGALLGGAGTLALAFHGLSAAAFTTQKGFDALNPVQQRFVQTLRSLDAGLGHTLEGIAQRTVLLGVTSGLRSAFTPASTGALAGGVGAFGGALSGGAQQFGRLFGSAGFAGSFGSVLQADARYLRDMLDGTTRLTNAFVHLLEAAIPLTDWMDKGLLDLAKWAESATLAGQASGGLASFFEKSKQALQGWGSLIASVGAAFGALFGAIGFDNSLKTLNLVTQVFQGFANFINANKDILRDFFTGALAAAQDMLTVIGKITGALTPLLAMINDLVKATAGWNRVIEALAIVWLSKFALMRAGVYGTVMATVGLSSALGKAGLLGAVGLAAFEIGTLILKLTGLDGWLHTVGSSAYDAAAKLGLVNQTPAGALNAQFTPAIQTQLAGAYNLAMKAFPGTGDPGIDKALRDKFVQQLVGSGYTFHDAEQFANAAARSAGAWGNPTGAMAQSGAAAAPQLAPTVLAGGAFGKPKPLLGPSASGVLPAVLEMAIARAESNAAAGGSTRPQIEAMQAGIRYIEAHVGAIKDPTLAGRYYQERTSLYGQVASIQSAEAAARKTAADAKTAAADEAEAKRVAGVQASFHHILGISGGVPGLAALRTSLRRTEAHVAEAREKGESIPKATLTALDKIHGVLEKSLKLHAELDSLTRGNIVARLAQINDTLKVLVHGHPSTYRVPSETKLLEMAGLSHLPAGERQRVGAVLASLASHGGKLPTGPTAFGIPTGAHSSLHVHHHHGDTNVVVEGAGHPVEVARAVVHEVQKAARRNATQTRGPNAGRNRGLN